MCILIKGSGIGLVVIADESRPGGPGFDSCDSSNFALTKL